MNSDELRRASILLHEHELEWIRRLVPRIHIPGRARPLQLDEVGRWEPVNDGEHVVLRLRDGL